MKNAYAQLFHNRGGGFNQTGAYRTYNMSVVGYSNGIYGPSNQTGDTGEKEEETGRQSRRAYHH